MKEIISKKEFDDLMKIEGKTRGVSIKDYGNYILEQKGEQGLKKLEETITNLGYNIEYRKIKAMSFYPVGLEGVTLLAIKRLFDFDDEKIKEMAVCHAKVSILIRLFMKYFFSVKKTAAVVPRMWRSFYTTGSAKVVEYDEEKRKVIIRVKDFSLLPIHCVYLSSYFATILQLIVGSKTVTCKEIKCTFKGEKYHDFLLEW